MLSGKKEKRKERITHSLKLIIKTASCRRRFLFSVAHKPSELCIFMTSGSGILARYLTRYTGQEETPTPSTCSHWTESQPNRIRSQFKKTQPPTQLILLSLFLHGLRLTVLACSGCSMEGRLGCKEILTTCGRPGL